MPNNGIAQSPVQSAYKSKAHAPRISGPLPGPKARAIVEADDRWMSPSYTRSYPLVAKRGRGTRIEDVDGNEFLDFAAGIAVVSTGHCHPEVVKAIQHQAGELIHMSGTDFYYEGLVTLAERLSAVAPMPGPHRFYYGNSGAEAVECALKLARYHTGRQNVIAFLGAFHGRTMGALSLTASKPQQKRRFAPLVPGVTHVRYPYAYRGCSGGPQEEEAFALGCARYIEEKLFKTMLPPEEVAAIFVEPIQGEGGYVVAPTIFMQELRRICDRHGILLVADEVQSGAGRTGKWWAIEHTGVEPDMVCMAKGIAIRHAARHLHDARRDHGLDAGLARVDIRRKSGRDCRGAGDHGCARARGHRQCREDRRGHKEAAAGTGSKTHPIVGDVRGRGLMIGIEIVKDQKTREVAPQLRDRIVDLAFERGLLILGCGETAVRLAPPLIVQQGEVDVALDILEECIEIAQGEHNIRETKHQESVHASQS